MAIEIDRSFFGAQPTRATLSAVIVRADGSIEDLGIIADSDWEKPSLAQRFINFFRKDVQ